MADPKETAKKIPNPSPINYISWLSTTIALLLVLRIEKSEFLDHADEYHVIPFLFALGVIAFGNEKRELLRCIVSKKFSVIIVGIVGLALIIVFDLPGYPSDPVGMGALDWVIQSSIAFLLGLLIAFLILLATAAYKLKAARRSKRR